MIEFKSFRIRNLFARLALLITVSAVFVFSILHIQATLGGWRENRRTWRPLHHDLSAMKSAVHEVNERLWYIYGLGPDREAREGLQEDVADAQSSFEAAMAEALTLTEPDPNQKGSHLEAAWAEFQKSVDACLDSLGANDLAMDEAARHDLLTKVRPAADELLVGVDQLRQEATAHEEKAERDLEEQTRFYRLLILVAAGFSSVLFIFSRPAAERRRRSPAERLFQVNALATGTDASEAREAEPTLRPLARPAEKRAPGEERHREVSARLNLDTPEGRSQTLALMKEISTSFRQTARRSTTQIMKLQQSNPGLQKSLETLSTAIDDIHRRTVLRPVPEENLPVSTQDLCREVEQLRTAATLLRSVSRLELATGGAKPSTPPAAAAATATAADVPEVQKPKRAA